MRVFLAVAVLVAGCDLVYGLERPPTNGWVELVVGNSHVCGLTRNRAVFCWGSNTSGEVGVGDELSTIDAPRKVEGTWTQVSTTYLHTCAIGTDGAASCWGYNANGQLGSGSMTGTRIPKPVAGEWSKVYASYLGSCAIDVDAHLWCWGTNNAGQIGDGTTIGRLEPVSIGDARWIDVSMGLLHTCGVQEDGTLWCWGDDSSTMPMPIGDPALAMSSIVPVQLGTDTWRSLATVLDGTCGITTAGRLRCWGNNKLHQLGVGDAIRADEPSPVLVDGEDADDWVEIEGGGFAACGVRENGEAWCWGVGAHGELTGDDAVVVAPRRIAHPDDDKWARVSVGGTNACFIDNNERAWCTGADSFSQLADGGTSPRTPVPPAPDVPADLVATGDHISCTISNKLLACGGKGLSLQLGDDTILPRRTLGPVAGTWDTVSLGYEHTCGLQTGGIAFCWGADRGESLGNGGGVVPSATPTMVMTARSFLSIDAGAYFTCAVDTARAAACWGNNSSGQLGNNTQTDSGLPTTVVGSMPMMMWNSVSAGLSHACGIQTTGVVRCWGDNTYGQLGDNTMDEHHAATTTLVSGGGPLPAFVKVSAGVDQTCALGVDNTLWCWGNNASGQLGVDTGFLVVIPVAKPVLGSWADVAAGNHYTCAVRTDQTMWCWGVNSRGQLGDGTLIDRRTAVQIEGTGWTAVAAGTDHTCGRRGTSVLCWGNNDEGATLTGDAWTTELQEIVEPRSPAP